MLLNDMPKYAKGFNINTHRNTYSLGLLVFFNCLVGGIGELHLRSQFGDNEVAGSIVNKQQFS